MELRARVNQDAMASWAFVSFAIEPLVEFDFERRLSGVAITRQIVHLPVVARQVVHLHKPDGG